MKLRKRRPASVISPEELREPELPDAEDAAQEAQGIRHAYNLSCLISEIKNACQRGKTYIYFKREDMDKEILELLETKGYTFITNERYHIIRWGSEAAPEELNNILKPAEEMNRYSEQKKQTYDIKEVICLIESAARQCKKKVKILSKYIDEETKNLLEKKGYRLMWKSGIYDLETIISWENAKTEIS